MNRKHGIIALLTVLLAGEIAQGGILRGSVRTAEGDPIAARIMVLGGPVDAGVVTI